jgi:Fic family protein
MSLVEEAPALSEALHRLPPERLAQLVVNRIQPTVDGRYLHWDTLRHRTPPGDLTLEEWWFTLKFARNSLLHALPLRNAAGQQFRYGMPDRVLEGLHRVDQEASGQIAISEEVTNSQTRHRYIVSSLIEEAITSSQLEGASTTHRVAEEMLRTGRPARTRDERMILNNYEAMNLVREWDGPLTPDRVLELHRVVTRGTLDNPDAAGRLQTSADERVHIEAPDGEVVFMPPPADQLPDRLVTMCAFANGQGVDGFLHPVVRAILLHFWLAHDHPFEDGNGRTARTLFYWSMLSQGYWLTEFLSISRILRNAPMQYARSFLYSERDEGDTTYFIDYQLAVLHRAIDDLHDYLQRQMAEIRDSERLLRDAALNHRQVALVRHALRHPNAEYTIKSHQRSHDVVYQSARTDLLDLADRGYLERSRVGRAFRFHPSPGLRDLVGHE